jgi:tetratricopeptide (TPR) repeat protein
MALNKAKVLKSAGKYVIQGKISHAIAEYQKLIKEDPTDLPLVNTLGDLYVRIGNIPEAVKCFGRLAESYDNGGFVVRAIAMYKKVSKIDPGQIQVLSRLADLYLRQGLNSDARVHYLQGADYLTKKGDLENALAIYQKVIGIDPENPAADGRAAEILQKLGSKEGALAGFLSAGAKARRKGAFEEAAGYLKKARELDHNDVPALLAYAEVLSELGKAGEALTLLDGIPLQDFKPEVLQTGFNIHLQSGNLHEAEKIADQLMELHPQYFKLRAALSSALLLKGDLDKAAIQVGKVADIAVKHGEGRIVESQLKSILQKTPDHVPSLLELIKYYNASNQHQYIPGLLEKAGGIYVRRDKLPEAASIYLQLVQLEPNDPVHRENLRQIQERLGLSGEEEQLPPLVPEMGAIAEKFISEPTLKTITPEESTAEAMGSSDEHEKVKGFIVEGDLFSGYGLYQKAIEQYQQVIKVIPHHIEVHEKVRDMYAKSGELTKAAQHCLILANIFAARNEAENANRNFTLAYQYDPNLHQQLIQPEPRAEPPASSPQRAAPEATTKRLEEFLQEMDFYLDLGFLSEAKSSMDRYLQIGNTADAEFQKRQQRYQNLVDTQGTKDENAKSEIDTPIFTGPEVSEEIGTDEFESTRVAPEPESIGPVAIDKTAGFETTCVTTEPVPPAEPQPADSFDEMMIDLDEELVESTGEKTVAPEVVAAVSQETAVAEPSSPVHGGLEDVFEEFKVGMEDDSDRGDFETHYNLGIAFKEMGLFEEAIGEFQKALRIHAQDIATEEFLECCNMLGLCFVENGLPQVAIKWFTKGLSSPGHHEETYQALRYDLGCAHEMAGNTKAALDTFLDVYGVNINYRDVSEKIENLKNRING